MANPEHLAILKQGVEVWNEWREKNPIIEPDLSAADLFEMELQQVDFSKTNLAMSNLVATDLRNANLREASLHEAFLAGTRLNGSNLYGADLGGTSFIGADLKDANLSGVHLYGTLIADVDLSEVRGLETVEHFSQSIIDTNSIYRSGGTIPEVFLRGCGVPDIFIEYSRSLVGKPIQFFSCFISHSHHDQRFCERLYADLQANGVRVWYFPEDAKWGESVWGEIDRSIKMYDKLVVVCSKHSLTSGPVLREIERALNREDKEGKNILFPITIDDYVFDEWEHPRKADVLAKVVGDFRGWNRSAAKYDAAFKKLLKALKA